MIETVVVAVVFMAAFFARSLLRVGEHLLEDEVTAWLPYQADRSIEKAIPANGRCTCSGPPRSGTCGPNGCGASSAARDGR